MLCLQFPCRGKVFGAKLQQGGPRCLLQLCPKYAPYFNRPYKLPGCDQKIISCQNSRFVEWMGWVGGIFWPPEIQQCPISGHQKCSNASLSGDQNSSVGHWPEQIISFGNLICISGHPTPFLAPEMQLGPMLVD